MIPVSEFDRAKTDHKNLSGVITSVDYVKKLYEISTPYGKLNKHFVRIQFALADSPLMAAEDVSSFDKATSVREMLSKPCCWSWTRLQKYTCTGNYKNKH